MKQSEFLKSVRGASIAELKQKARQIAEELMKLRFRQATGQLEKSSTISLTKRNMARVLTLIRERVSAEKQAN